jgi:hypothetical protein
MLGALAVILAITLATPASAQTAVSEQQFQALAQRAIDDPRALTQLRAVREVEGRAVDVGRALAGAEGPALAARLRTLADGGSPTAPAVGAADARREAGDVLDGRRFKRPRVPRPLEGILRTLGRWIRPVAGPLGRAWARVAGSVGGQLALVAAVFAIAIAVSTVLVGRRSARSLQRSRPLGVDGEGLDPDELERRATAAERAGDLATAVRLRFVAGVLRLDRAGVISYRSSLTTGQLRSSVRSPSFADLAAAFDEIAYGGRPARPADVETATAGWPRVLTEAGR